MSKPDESLSTSRKTAVRLTLAAHAVTGTPKAKHPDLVKFIERHRAELGIAAPEAVGLCKCSCRHWGIRLAAWVTYALGAALAIGGFWLRPPTVPGASPILYRYLIAAGLLLFVLGEMLSSLELEIERDTFWRPLVARWFLRTFFPSLIANLRGRATPEFGKYAVVSRDGPRLFLLTLGRALGGFMSESILVIDTSHLPFVKQTEGGFVLRFQQGGAIVVLRLFATPPDALAHFRLK